MVYTEKLSEMQCKRKGAQKEVSPIPLNAFITSGLPDFYIRCHLMDHLVHPHHRIRTYPKYVFEVPPGIQDG